MKLWIVAGPRTYTAFAPTERAFATLKEPELARLLSERAAARAFVTRHVLPTTLYSAGMRYYQVKDTMARGKQITIVNDEGKTSFTFKLPAFSVTDMLPTSEKFAVFFFSFFLSIRSALLTEVLPFTLKLQVLDVL